MLCSSYYAGLMLVMFTVGMVMDNLQPRGFRGWRSVVVCTMFTAGAIYCTVFGGQ